MSDLENKASYLTFTGTIFRLQGAILTMSFLDSQGLIIPSVSEQWKDFREDRERKYISKLQSKYRFSFLTCCAGC